ncbi:MAG: site-specific DNA-methyltransferase [Nanoarchaeota archaeon]|nr:site-specific DNA-methyltransferase [Nanoarchaeota archaeon]
MYHEVESVRNYLKNFNLDNNSNGTIVKNIRIGDKEILQFINEFWTSKQRKASSLHEVSYRACFKPQLPKFFIELLTKEGDIVYDPFSGRGTTIIEAALLGRKIIANDISPLSQIFSKPRLFVPSLEMVRSRLDTIKVDEKNKADIDLSMFYEDKTETEIIALKKLLDNEKDIDMWIRMVATNRLTGHSSGFFSVYTLPPNQAVSAKNQIKINQKRQQIPPYRNTKEIILKKTKGLTRNITEEDRINLANAGKTALFLQNDARSVPEVENGSVQLTVTSPPFLDIVHYSKDNWLRCWFNNIDSKEIEHKITMSRTVEQWSSVMADVFKELYRITKNEGWVAFEVGEIRKGTIKLDEVVVPLGLNAGFTCAGIIINQQIFTKTANIWGITNNNLGTNSNRIVIFYKA